MPLDASGVAATAQAPPSLASAARAARAARGNPEEVRRLLERSAIPMALLDADRRFADLNRPGRLLVRKSLGQIRALRTDDLSPPESLPLMMEAWRELVTNGSVSGSLPLRFEDGSRLDVVYWAIAYAADDLHLVAGAPADWPDQELAPTQVAGAAEAQLTAREREVLRLAAEGNSASQIAELLVIGESTVKTHLANVYAKLGVPDRAAAVATAIRRGLIT